MLTRLLRYTCLALIGAGTVIAGGDKGGTASAADETKLQGVLIDELCSHQAEPRVVSGPRLEGGIIVAYTHTRECALMPECRKSGYGVFTYDQKFVPFDAEGNQKALSFFEHTKQENDFRVEVTGHMRGEHFHPDSITLLP